jgi:hypothetical protein
MLNLASLSALLRTLRQAGDGAAAPVERIAHVRRPAAEGEMQLPAQTTWRDRPRGVLLPAGLLDDAAPDRHGTARAGPQSPLRESGATATMAARLPASMPLDADGPSASLDLTRAGALVAAALQAAPARPRAHVEAARPLVAHERAAATDLARSLARSLADSGLFYEAHLARWTRDEYPAAALAREPQAHWPAIAPGTGDVAMPRPAALPDAAAALLNRQLDALDARQIVWTGSLWPGQPATIAFDELPAGDEDANADGTAAKAPGAWRTHIALDLPSLGRIEADVALAGDRLDVHLAAPHAQSAERLEAARDALAHALAPSHLALAAFAVTRAVTAEGPR